MEVNNGEQKQNMQGWGGGGAKENRKKNNKDKKGDGML